MQGRQTLHRLGSLRHVLGVAQIEQPIGKRQRDLRVSGVCAVQGRQTLHRPGCLRRVLLGAQIDQPLGKLQRDLRVSGVCAVQGRQAVCQLPAGLRVAAFISRIDRQHGIPQGRRGIFPEFQILRGRQKPQPVFRTFVQQMPVVGG